MTSLLPASLSQNSWHEDLLRFKGRPSTCYPFLACALEVPIDGVAADPRMVSAAKTLSVGRRRGEEAKRTENEAE